MEKTPKQRFYERTDISQTNKDYMTKFFKRYNCPDTSGNKFYSYMPYVLKETPDVIEALKNEDLIIDIFDKIHANKRLSPSTYKTILVTTKTFCRELNGKKTPEVLNKVKQLTTQEIAKLKRINSPDYKTISWEDGLKMGQQTNSVQIKAMPLVELEAGLRPDELVSLNFGDVKRDGKFIILKIGKSKTGKSRDVVLYRSVPALNRWLQNHPTKKAEDSLWILENKNKSSLYKNNKGVVRYGYHAIRQLFRRLAKKAGINKKINMYLLRHSAVALAKQENMGVDIAAEKFGHDINYYINTYGKLTDKQKIDRFKAHYGEGEEQEDKTPKPLLCELCNTPNDPEAAICEKCRNPLTLTKALELEKQKENKIKTLEKQVADLPSQILAKLVDNPEILRQALKLKG